MYDGAYKYIEQNYPNVQYSPVKYLQSKVVGTTTVAAIECRKQNAIGILIHSIQWETLAPGALGAPVTFTTNKVVLLSQLNIGGYNEKNFFAYYIANSNIVNVVANSAEISFIVEYQFVTLPERKTK